jgi:hypothetical protein
LLYKSKTSYILKRREYFLKDLSKKFLIFLRRGSSKLPLRTILGQILDQEEENVMRLVAASLGGNGKFKDATQQPK